MKALRIFTAIVVAVLTLSLSAQAQNKKKAPKYEEVTFSAHIHCNNCKAKCDAALPYIKGVKDVKVSVEEQTVWFKYDPTKVTKQKLGAELAELGYPGKEIVKEEKK
ncbi:MAG: heavy-metal-associated domain-containing protein [Bacteroidales bacterium]|nr:heavy-metal-associated domain-containing protein [Bacteroidales bacterium]